MIAKIGGALIGAALALYALVYLPMSRNYAECGKITLCAASVDPGERFHPSTREAGDANNAPASDK
jgi:hypothetical protein